MKGAPDIFMIVAQLLNINKTIWFLCKSTTKKKNLFLSFSPSQILFDRLFITPINHKILSFHKSLFLLFFRRETFLHIIPRARIVFRHFPLSFQISRFPITRRNEKWKVFHSNVNFFCSLFVWIRLLSGWMFGKAPLWQLNYIDFCVIKLIQFLFSLSQPSTRENRKVRAEKIF